MYENNNKISRKVLIFILLDVLVISLGHLVNINIIILIGLIGFLSIVLFSPKSFFLPIMLFYLPWSPIMKFTPGSLSFYTIVVPIFFISLMLWGKQQTNKKVFIKENLLITIILIFYTMTVKLFLGYSISLSYLYFMMMLVLIPTYLNTYQRKISFEYCIIFFSLGVISAGLSSKALMNYPHMKQFIDVYEWEQVGLTRLSGFYADSNFYSAHILLAICGLLVIAINKKLFKAVLIFITSVILIYLGFLSVSKMFILELFLLLGIWVIAVLSIRGKIGKKIGIFLCVVISFLFILWSGIFDDQINMYLIRFGMVEDTDSLTSNRSVLLYSYISLFKGSLPALLFGQGYTNVFAGNIVMGSHNSIAQLVYQFGLIGVPFIILWIYQLGRIAGRGVTSYFNGSNIYLIIAFIIACFLPWFALDILFFDEFFYITTLFFIGKNYIGEMYKEA